MIYMSMYKSPLLLGRLIKAALSVQRGLLSRVVQAQCMKLQVGAKLLCLRCLGGAVLLCCLRLASLLSGSLHARHTICRWPSG